MLLCELRSKVKKGVHDKWLIPDHRGYKGRSDEVCAVGDKEQSRSCHPEPRLVWGEKVPQKQCHGVTFVGTLEPGTQACSS